MENTIANIRILDVVRLVRQQILIWILLVGIQSQCGVSFI
jgi:hypothetical protein